MWQLGDNGRDGASWGDFLSDDRLHPNDRGHKLMAEMVIFMLQQTAIELLVQPITSGEVAASRAPLPPPMFEGEPRAEVHCTFAALRCAAQPRAALRCPGLCCTLLHCAALRRMLLHCLYV